MDYVKLYIYLYIVQLHYNMMFFVTLYFTSVCCKLRDTNFILTRCCFSLTSLNQLRLC